jgi:quinol-cytochrome oxidoreductase complex cytochrome b subunit
MPDNDAQRKPFPLCHLLLHFRPATVEAPTIRLTLSWGLGGTAVVLVLLQLASGVLLKFLYEPTPQAAHASVGVLIYAVPFGRLIRNLHHWGAHLLVVITFLHLLRVLFTGAFHSPRRFNWIVGLVLMVLILTADFTGRLLPWDQPAYWGSTVSVGMLAHIPWVGGALSWALHTEAGVGRGTLRLFFAVHTAVVPMALIAMMALHFWRIRKAGGLVRRPGTDGDDGRQVPLQPELLTREAAAALAVIAAVMLVALFVDAPLGDPANPGLSPGATRPPWYLAGFQELLLHLPPFVALGMVPLVFGAALTAIPYLGYGNPSGGNWFVSPIGRRVTLTALATALVMTPAVVLLNERFCHLQQWAGGNAWIAFALLVGVVAGIYGAFRHIGQASTRIAVQGVFTFVAAAYVLLTMINLWLRGEGMALNVPW